MWTWHRASHGITCRRPPPLGKEHVCRRLCCLGTLCSSCYCTRDIHNPFSPENQLRRRARWAGETSGVLGAGAQSSIPKEQRQPLPDMCQRSVLASSGRSLPKPRCKNCPHGCKCSFERLLARSCWPAGLVPRLAASLPIHPPTFAWPAGLLSAFACTTNSNKVSSQNTNAGTGRQTWMLEPLAAGTKDITNKTVVQIKVGCSNACSRAHTPDPHESAAPSKPPYCCLDWGDGAVPGLGRGTSAPADSSCPALCHASVQTQAVQGEPGVHSDTDARAVLRRPPAGRRP